MGATHTKPGSGILLNQGNAVIENCVFRDTTCSGIPVAAALQNNSHLVALDCVFKNLNGKGTVGADYNTVANNDNTFWATNCTFQDNYSGVGTVYTSYALDGRVFLTRCLFQSNSVPNSGVQDSYASSGVFIWGKHPPSSLLTIDRCRFIDNTNGVLFGISYMAAITIDNSLFVNNQCNWDLIHGYNWAGTILNSTFVRNKGTLSGRYPGNGGIYLRNSIISSNATDIGGGEGPYLTIQTSMVWQASLGLYNAGGSAGVITGLDPLLRADYHLPWASPAVDTGDTALVSALVDLDGKRRVRAGAKGALIVDLGCYEAEGLGAIFLAH